MFLGEIFFGLHFFDPPPFRGRRRGEGGEGEGVRGVSWVTGVSGVSGVTGVKGVGEVDQGGIHHQTWNA